MGEVIEIFGKRLKIVQDESDSVKNCHQCVLKAICYMQVICRDAKGKTNRHFEEVND